MKESKAGTTLYIWKSVLGVYWTSTNIPLTYLWPYPKQRRISKSASVPEQPYHQRHPAGTKPHIRVCIVSGDLSCNGGRDLRAQSWYNLQGHKQFKAPSCSSVIKLIPIKFGMKRKTLSVYHDCLVARWYASFTSKLPNEFRRAWGPVGILPLVVMALTVSYSRQSAFPSAMSVQEVGSLCLLYTRFLHLADLVAEDNNSHLTTSYKLRVSGYLLSGWNYSNLSKMRQKAL